MKLFVLGIGFVLASTVIAQAPVMCTQVVPLTALPALSNWNDARPIADRLESLRVTTGDLNGDGVPDLILSNELGLLRVHFLERQLGGTCGAGVAEKTLLTSPNYREPAELAWLPCSPTHWGRQTLSTFSLSSPCIYDIDLDGINELIYLRPSDTISSHNDRIRLAVWKWNPGTESFDSMVLAYPSDPSHALIGDLVYSSFFPASCSTTISGPHRGMQLTIRVGNFRGRAYPQDIIIAGEGSGLKDCVVFTFESTGPLSANIVRVADVSEGYSPSPWVTMDLVNVSEPGHTWIAADVDADGFDELVGKNVYKYSPTAMGSNRFSIMHPEEPPTEAVGATVFRLDGLLPATTDVHPDQVAVADFWSSYIDPAGNVIPCPGVELLVAPQLHSSSNSPGESGPWVYRGPAGHHLGADDVFGRRWPRKLLNFDTTLPAPERYWFTTITSSNYQQPHAQSNWAALGSFLAPSSGALPDPNAQGVLVANLVEGYDGPELLVTSKAIPGGVSSTCLNPGHVFYMFSGDTTCRALDWGHSYGTAGGPTIYGTRLADATGSRVVKEIVSTSGVGCSNQIPSIGLYSWGMQSGAVTRSTLATFDGATSGSWTVNPDESLGIADLVGDSREEIYYLSYTDPSAPGGPALRVRVIRDTSASSRPEPSPHRFVAYRLRNQAGDDSIEFDRFDGLRLTERLPDGQVGAMYGVPQASAIGGQGAALIPEGGVPPYQLTLEPGSDQLHAGFLTPQTISLPNSPHNSSGAGGWLIRGTPTAHGTRHLRVRVTDSSSPALVHVFDRYLRVIESPTSVDVRPKIVTGGYGNSYLQSGLASAQVLYLSASVEDGDANCVGVHAFFEGIYLTTLLPAGGTAFSGSFLLPPNMPPLEGGIQMIALDSDGNKSLTWPYLTVDGGSGVTGGVLPSSATAGQSAANTPTVGSVTFKPDGVRAAERGEYQDSLIIQAVVEFVPPGHVIDSVEAKVVHPLTQGAHFPSVAFTVVKPRTYVGKFYAPAGQFGWGEYSVCVRAITRDSAGVLFYSDWWPRIVIH